MYGTGLAFSMTGEGVKINADLTSHFINNIMFSVNDNKYEFHKAHPKSGHAGTYAFSGKLTKDDCERFAIRDPLLTWDGYYHSFGGIKSEFVPDLMKRIISYAGNKEVKQL